MSHLRRSIHDLLHDRQHDRILRLSFPKDDAPGAQLLVNKIDATESLSRDFEFTVELLCDASDLALKEMQGKLLNIELVRRDGSLRYFSGYVFSFRRIHSDGGITFYEARLGPWLKFLGLRKDNYLFHGKSLRDQTEEIFRDYGARAQWDWRVTRDDPVMTDACQFDETDFNYLSRRWEASGWYYWYEHDASGHKLVIGSNSTQAPAIDGAVEVRFHGEGSALEEDAIDRWSPERQAIPSSLVLNAFNFKDPTPSSVSVPTLNIQDNVPAAIRWLSFAALAGTFAFGGLKYRAHLEYVAMHTMPPGLYEFKVTDPRPVCGRWKDHMPHQRDPEAYRLYIKARNFWRSKKEFEFTREELQSILADVTLAAEKGDWGARALLAHFYLEGLGPLDTNKVLDSEPEKGVRIIRQAVVAGQAWGYYDLGVAYQYGYGGAAMDEVISWAYYRRAAELGSPDAQMALAEAYENAKRHDDALALRMCAYQQEHGPAANLLGTIAEVRGQFAEALKYYQDGIRFGDKEAAVSLMLFFRDQYWSQVPPKHISKLRELELRPDAERENRYDKISEALELNPDLRLKLLDKVLPLPPAELPPWNGIQDAVAPETDALPTY